jgi:hypothetical protein
MVAFNFATPIIKLLEASLVQARNEPVPDTTSPLVPFFPKCLLHHLILDNCSLYEHPGQPRTIRRERPACYAHQRWNHALACANPRALCAHACKHTEHRGYEPGVGWVADERVRARRDQAVMLGDAEIVREHAAERAHGAKAKGAARTGERGAHEQPRRRHGEGEGGARRRADHGRQVGRWVIYDRCEGRLAGAVDNYRELWLVQRERCDEGVGAHGS